MTFEMRVGMGVASVEQPTDQKRGLILTADRSSPGSSSTAGRRAAAHRDRSTLASQLPAGVFCHTTDPSLKRWLNPSGRSPPPSPLATSQAPQALLRCGGAPAAPPAAPQLLSLANPQPFSGFPRATPQTPCRGWSSSSLSRPLLCSTPSQPTPQPTCRRPPSRFPPLMRSPPPTPSSRVSETRPGQPWQWSPSSPAGSYLPNGW